MCLLVLCLSISPVMAADATTETHSVQQVFPLHWVQSFTEAFHRIRSSYVEKIDDSVLFENAIRGMLHYLDPHSSYLDKEALTDIEKNTTGQTNGIGIEVVKEKNGLKVIAPIDNTPAQKAGIQSGDLIIKMNGQLIHGIDFDEVLDKLSHPLGSTITLTIMRNDRSVDFTLTISKIQLDSVRSYFAAPGYAYLRISRFQNGTADEMKAHINKLKAIHPIKGTVIDLRNNPGGILQEAVHTSDIFLNKGLIVSTNGRVKESKTYFYATQGDRLDGTPIIILINGGTASASEVMAGALHDHRRAILAGEKTFGKGSVQKVIILNEETGIKLTTARYYTPKGKSIQGFGIQPSVVIPQVEGARVKTNSISVKEKDLSRYLHNLDAPPSGEENIVATLTQEKVEDYQLFHAFNVLKGLHLIHPPESTTDTGVATFP